jgi:hypothetical protein
LNRRKIPLGASRNQIGISQIEKRSLWLRYNTRVTAKNPPEISFHFLPSLYKNNRKRHIIAISRTTSARNLSRNSSIQLLLF